MKHVEAAVLEVAPAFWNNSFTHWARAVFSHCDIPIQQFCAV